MARIRYQRLGQIGFRLNREITDRITVEIGFRDLRRLTYHHSRGIHWVVPGVLAPYAPHGDRHIFISPTVRVTHSCLIVLLKAHGLPAMDFMILVVLHGHGGCALVFVLNDEG